MKEISMAQLYVSSGIVFNFRMQLRLYRNVHNISLSTTYLLLSYCTPMVITEE